jgi:hypothetical protein
MPPTLVFIFRIEHQQLLEEIHDTSGLSFREPIAHLGKLIQQLLRRSVIKALDKTTTNMHHDSFFCLFGFTVSSGV